MPQLLVAEILIIIVFVIILMIKPIDSETKKSIRQIGLIISALFGIADLILLIAGLQSWLI